MAKPKKKTQLRKGVERCADLLADARVLAIDPSISSASSSMGYAVYEAGQLVDAGIIDIRASLPKNRKLQEIRKVLTSDFMDIQVLVIENIAPMRVAGPGDFHKQAAITKGWKNLHQATGAAIASVDAEHVVEVAPVTWRKYLKGDYEKSDAADAVLIGYAAIADACDYLDRPAPTKYFLQSKGKIDS
jgi:hypothetical protein